MTARVNIGETGLDRERERLEISLTAASSGESVAKEVLAVPAEGRMQLRLPTRDPAVGPYWLKTRLVDVVTGETIDEVVNRLDRRRDSNPTCFIDRHNRVILNGQPFFPLGMYWSGVDEDQLRLYAGSPFNCLMPYGSPDREQMDLIQRAGLKVIYSIKDYYYGTTWCPDFIQSEADEEGAVRSRVREFRSHPALLAWYLNDERPLSMLPRLEAHQRWVEEEDPDHPTWIVLYQVGDVRRYERSFDAIGTDPYPIPDHPASMAGDWADLTRRAVADARSIWMVPQVFRLEGKERPPTLAELRSMAWQCIAEGADGLIFYSWFELRRDRQFPFEQRWKEVKQVAGEIAAATPVLLSTDPVPDDIAVDAPEAVHWTARGFEGDVYLFLVNDSAGPVTAEVRLSGEAGQATLGDRSVSVGADGALTVAMEPYGVEVCRIENRPR